MQGTVIIKHGGFYKVSCNGHIYSCFLSGKRKHFGKHTIVAGDHVNFELPADGSEEGYILDVFPRENFIPRPGVANVDQLLLIAAVREPDHSLYQLDKLLAVAHYYGISPSLCISKMDLGNSDDEHFLLSYYRNVPIKIFFVGENDSLAELMAYLERKVTVFAGNSGVGKSTLINRLMGREVQEVNEISLKLNRGKHTTRTVEFFSYAEGFIIDTPGFSSLSFPDDMSKEKLKELYEEYRAEDGNCKFNNCVHIHEPGCRIKELVGAGRFSPERYGNYCRLFQEIEARQL